MKKTIPLLLVCILFFSSCSSFFQVEKRHYRKGFYVQHYNTLEKKLNKDSDTSTTVGLKETKQNNAIPEKGNATPVHESDKKNKLLSNEKIVRRFHSIKKRVAVKFENSDTLHQKSKKEKDPNDRNIRIATTLGLLAIVLIIFGLIAIEFAVIFGLVPIVIGFFYATFGLRFGRTALNYGPKKSKRKSDTNEDPGAHRKRAKKAYLLNLIAILILFLYIIIRFGIVAVGTGAIGIALLLLGLCLMLFLLFKMGVFRDLRG